MIGYFLIILLRFSLIMTTGAKNDSNNGNITDYTSLVILVVE